MASYQVLPRQEQQADSETGNLNAYAEPYAALAKPGQWSTGFFDCCGSPGGTGLCCMSTWCPCIQYGKNVEQLAQVSTVSQALSRDPDGVVCGGSFWGACLTYCVLGSLGSVVLGGIGNAGHGAVLMIPCVVPLHLQLRVHMRKKYGLQGDFVTDMLMDTLAVWCCPACAMCQEAREITIRQAAERAGLAAGTGGFTPPPNQAVTYPAILPAAGGGPADAMGYIAPPLPAYGTPVAPPPPPPPATGIPVSLPPGKQD